LKQLQLIHILPINTSNAAIAAVLARREPRVNRIEACNSPRQCAAQQQTAPEGAVKAGELRILRFTAR
jgi:hypothetical protein